jgi:hypothetical protein
MRYTIADGALTVADDSGNELWKGRPEGHPVEWVTPVPEQADAIVMYHYYRPKRPYGGFNNLVRIHPDGSIVWRAALPQSDDEYTFAALDGTKLIASSWNGFRVEINLETGKITSQKFTK